MSVPLRRGRFFTKFDKPGSAQVVVINETMARRYFGNENPLGKKLVVMYDPPESREIVGVIADVLHNGLDSAPRPEMFVHYQQSPTPQMTFVVKTAGDPGAMLSAVKGAIREINRNQTFSKTATMEQLWGLPETAAINLLRWSFAYSRGACGTRIYGLIATQQQRTHEIGLTHGLGGQSADVID